MTTLEITEILLEIYDVEVSPALISKVTDSVIEKVVEWQSRPLDAVYPIVTLDCIVVKIRQDKQVINKAIYLALGVNLEGHKELLGLWVSENEGANYADTGGLHVLTELQNRGVKDILRTSVEPSTPRMPSSRSTVSLGRPLKSESCLRRTMPPRK